MTAETTFIKKRAPTLYAIIAIKLIKGSLLVAGAWAIYALSDDVLPDEFAKLLQILHLDPGTQAFRAISAKLARITEHDAVVFAAGMLAYSLFSLVEGIGLIFRISWAGWLAIGEAVFFIPVEIHSLWTKFAWTVLGILILNIFIVWYLFANRHRLFRHHHHHDEAGVTPPADPSSVVGK